MDAVSLHTFSLCLELFCFYILLWLFIRNKIAGATSFNTISSDFSAFRICCSGLQSIHWGNSRKSKNSANGTSLVVGCLGLALTLMVIFLGRRWFLSGISIHETNFSNLLIRIPAFNKGTIPFWPRLSAISCIHYKQLGIFLFFGMLAGVAWGQPASSTWDLTANGSPVTSGNIGAANITIGSGVSGPVQYTVNGAGTQGWDTPGFDPDDFYEYKVTASAGYTFTISSLEFGHSVSASTMNAAVYYSLDGFSTAGIQLGSNITVTTSPTSELFSLNATINSGSSFALRIYGWDAATSGHRFYNKNVVITGTTCALPTSYSVTGGGSYCQGGAGVPVGLEDSESGVNYQLYEGTNALGIVAGTGGAISFGNQTTPGTYTVIATRVAGGCSNTMTGSASVVVNIPPAITSCPSPVVTAYTGPGTCTATVTYSVTASGTPSPTYSYVFTGATVASGPGAGSGSVFNGGTTHVTVTASNSCGTDICTFDINVVDTVHPTIVCPAGINTTTNSGCTATGIVLGTPVTSDNCSVASVTNNAPAAFATGTTLVTWTVTDNSGLTTSCIQSVTVADNIPPTISCPPNVNVTTNNGCTATGVVLGVPVTGDNCSVASVTNNAPAAFSLGTTVVTWTVTDGSGNTATCQQTVTVTDNVLPTINCPANISVFANASCTATGVNLGNPVTSDKCSVASVTNNAPASYPLGNTSVTWTVTDGSGNTNTCQQTVTVTDNIPPVITCPTPAASYTTDPNSCTRSLSFTATATDNCSIQFIKYYIGGSPVTFPYSFPKGSTVVTAVATDGSNNTSQCNFTVNVSDLQLPVITCPVNQSRSVNSGVCNYTAVGNEFDPLAYSDNCPGATISNNINSGTTLAGVVFPLGTTSVTWTVKDASNNVTVCSFSINVVDNQAPVLINCPANMTVYTGPGRLTCNQTATWTPPTASDNCSAGSITITSTHSPGSTFPVGATLVTYTATDPSGNSSTCSFTVTVIDNTVPTFTAPADITIYLSATCTYNSGVAFTGDVTNEFDNCTVSGLQATYTDNPPVPGSCPGTAQIVRQWRLEDIHGNVTTHSQRINIADNTAPNLTTPPNKTIQCNESTLPANTGQATATDNSNNCGGTVVITYSDISVPGSCANNSTITRTWTATDCSGNSTSKIQTITRVDNTRPVASVSNITVACPSNIPFPDPSVVTATDNCGSVNIILFDEIPFGLEGQPGYCPNQVNRIYRVTDLCGNFTDVTQVITVQSLCGCSPCATSNAFFTIDLIGQPTGDTTIYDVQRMDKCCDATKSYCASFNVRLDDDAVGVQITIDGATPVPQDWRIDCEGVSINDGIVCIPGGAFHLFTFCKPGANLNDFTFTSIAGVVSSQDITARVDCGTQITVSSNVTNPVWNSINPGTYGQYNNYLYPNNTTLNPVFVPDGSSPPEIQYQICGNIGNYYCSTTGSDCDTITVHVRDSISTVLNIDPSDLCLEDNSVLEAIVSPAGTYIYQWFNAYNGGGAQVSGNQFFQPVTPGPYSVIVSDIQNDFPCGSDTLNFDVAFDLTAPVVTPPAKLVLECNDPTNPQTITNWLLAATASDDGGTTFLPVTNDYTGIVQACGAYATVTFSAVDNCGNVGTATADITIIDTSVPFWFTEPGDLDQTVECSDALSLQFAQSLEPFASDACDQTVSSVKTPGAFIAGSCPQAGSYTNTWIAKDVCGNSSIVYTQVITVIDDVAPVWSTSTGSLNRSISCDDAAALALAQSLAPLATDNCDLFLSPVKTSGGFIPGICPNTGTYTNTWTVADDCGNTSSIYTQVISVSDLTPPVLLTPAQDLTVECDGSGNAVSLAGWLSANGGASASDNCSASVIWSNNFNGLSDLCGSTGSATVIFTASDSCGNSVTSQAVFSITDTQPPTVTCPPDASGTIDPVTCLATNVVLGSASATDICSAPVTLTNNAPPAGFPVGVTYVTWTATDDCGNSDTCMQKVTVLDDLPPINILCPGNVTGNAAADECGANMTVPAPVVTDPCGAVFIVNNYNNTSNASGYYPVGITTVIWSISDASGNTDTCMQTVTVTDTQAPNISCPGDQSFTAPPPDCQLVVNAITAPVLSDNCDVADLILSFVLTGATTGSGTGSVNGTSFNVGATIVTYTVTDSSGNEASCSFTITINDQVPPTIIDCPDDISVAADPGACGTSITIPAPVVSDPCNEVVSITNSFNGTGNASGYYPVGITTVTWTVTDVSGNVSVCTQLVTVTENEPPVISCPPDQEQLIINGGCELTNVTIVNPTFSDNCTVSTLTWMMTGATIGNSPASGINYVSGQTFNVGITTVTYVAADPSGNTDTCSFTVWIKNLNAPQFSATCPADIAVPAAPGLCQSYVTVPAPVISNPCNELYTVTNDSPYQSSSVDASGTYPAGTTSVTWTITDASGNITVCIQQVTVNDTEAPELTCPPDQEQQITNGGCDLTNVTIIDPVFSDNCSVISLTWAMTGATSGNSPASGINYVTGQTFNVGITTVTYTAADGAGNTAICSFTVWIKNLIAPQFSAECPPNVTIPAEAGTCHAYVTVPPPVITNPCNESFTVVNNSPYQTSLTDASGTYSVGSTTVTWVVTDASGNITLCDQVIAVSDTQAPLLTCPPDQEQLITNGGCSLSNVSITDPVFSDNCGVTVLTWEMTGATTGNSPASGINYVTGQTFNVGITTVTYTAADSSGNTDTCSFTVWIKNLNAPQFAVTCPADVSVPADPGQCSAYVTVPPPQIYNPCNELYSVVNNSPYQASLTDASGTYPIGTTLVTWTVTDASGNITTCIQSVAVSDLPPMLLCPPDLVADADFEKNYASNVSIGVPVYSDNCPGITLTWISSAPTPGSSPPTGINIDTVSIFYVGITTITYTLTDTSGLMVSCSFTVTVLAEPVIECPDDTTVYADPGLCSASLDPGEPRLISGVEPIVWAWTMTGATTGSGTGRPILPDPYTFNVGITNITWTATNISGADTCSQVLTVIDNQAPTFASPGPFNLCVLNIDTAIYWDPTMDIMPDRPDYYLFEAGSTIFDLDPGTFSDNCGISCITEIRWRIDFADGTSLPLPPQLYLTGQPSTYGSDIFIPGAESGSVVHTITYQIVDCNGNASLPHTVNIIIQPRPTMIKMN